MKKKVFAVLVICIAVCFLGCAKENTPTPVSGQKTTTETHGVYEPADNPGYWTLERQRDIYEKLFSEMNLDEAWYFRHFVESLAQYHHDDPVYEYNPFFLCCEKYPEILPLMFEAEPELFLCGNCDTGDWSESPIIYVIKNNLLEWVKFFFENNIPFSDVSDNVLYGSLNRGGPRFRFGGNLLLYAEDSEIRDYLISQGIPSESKPKAWYEYYLTIDSTDVYAEPGLGNPVLTSITRETSFTVESILTYRIDGTQWMKIVAGNTEGWIQTTGVGYDSGI